MRTLIPAILLSGICLVLVWRHLGPVLFFLLGGRIRHSGLPAGDPKAPKPKGPMIEAFEEMGFTFLGIRTERLGLIWGRQSLVLVRNDGTIADLASPDRLAGAYLAGFWKNGACVITKAEGRREVQTDDYRSACLPTKNPADLLAAHFRNEQAVLAAWQDQADKLVPASMEERLDLARQWWQRNRKAEFALPAAIGALFTAASLALWAYGLWYLSLP